MTGTVTELSTRIYRAVNAELARRGLDKGDLVPVLGIGRNAVYDRLRGTVPLDTVELGKIVLFLGISLERLLESAALDELAPEVHALAS